MDNTDYKIYSQGDAQRGVLYHVREKLNGTYSITEANNYDIAHVTYGSVNFKFSNKFDGFELYGYSFSFSSSDAGVTTVQVGNQVSFNSKTDTLYVYHRRNEAALIFDENYVDFGEQSTKYTLEHIKYQQPLKAYKNAYVPGTRKHYNFTGWYEDVTCTQPFDFEKEIMPNANKVLYAGWTTERYRITVDADGGEMDPGGTFSTYFKINYNEMIDEYAGIRKNYIEAPDDGTYVYFDFSYDKLTALDPAHYGTKMTDAEGNLDFPGALRKSFYIIGTDENITQYFNSVCAVVGDKEYKYSDYFDNVETFKTFIKKNNQGGNVLYKQSPGEYALYGWFKVIDDAGNTEPTPYNFMNHVEENIKLKAKWVQVGKYSFAYNPTMNSTGITGDMARYNDPLESDRFYVDGASAVVLQAPTDLRVDAQGHHDDPQNPYQHNVDPDQYVFRGWRIVDDKGAPMEDNVFYNPGDTIEVNHNFAKGNVIHMEAYYEKKESTVRRVDYTSLTLHANVNNTTGTGEVNGEGLNSANHETADLAQKTVVLDRLLNNGEIHLNDYFNNFTNTSGYKLIGWNSDPDSDSFIPEYCTDAVIGVHQDNTPNHLYAVWEPMVYLTLNNSTEKPMTFTLKIMGNESTAYNGNINIIGDHQRTAFADGITGVTVSTLGTGEYSVTLNPDINVKLVLPQGLDCSYTVSGSYATQNEGVNASNLFVYNSGDEKSVSITYNSSASQWDKYYGQNDHETCSPGGTFNYSTTGTLASGTQGQMVMFSASDPTTQLNIRTAYYDTSTQNWIESDSATGPCVSPNFILPGNENPTSDTTVHLINNQSESVKFGLHVPDTSENFKFIGWYTTCGVSPNTPTVDNYVTGFGQQTVTGLSVPLEETTYYALYVPYASGDLIIKHSQKADSAGNCASEDGLAISVTYNNSTITGSGNQNTPAQCVINLDERYLAGSETIDVTVGAKAATGGDYNATYHNDEMVNGTLNSESGYYEHSYHYTVSQLLTVSDSVKGLVTMNNVFFYSEFSFNYEITYRYTARDGRKHDYVVKGVLESYDEEAFGNFVVSQTPYIRTLAGDTVWDVDNMKVTKEEGRFTALLEEIPDVRGYCKVTIIDYQGFTRYDTVPYGETFTKEQAEKWTAPMTKGNLTFDHWAIYNTDVLKAEMEAHGDSELAKRNAKISDCYKPEFHFAFWNDYTIEPVYTENPTGDPTSAWQFVTIDYIDTSRNQWGIETISTESEADRSQVTDKTVFDMDISFNDGANLILESFNEEGVNAYQLGVIFEQLGKLESTESGDFDKSHYIGEDDSKVKLRVRDVLGKEYDSSTGTDYYYGGSAKTGYYYTRININEDTVSNFNRSEFARSFNTANIKDKVFRVYAYMIVPGNNDGNIDDNEIILSDPYYMTMFDYAKNNKVL